MVSQRTKRNPDVEVLSFARNHRFKDTLALFLVFLSFNHVMLFLLLVVFIVATRFKNALANSFILFFLSKKPSPDIQVVSNSAKNKKRYVTPPTLYKLLAMKNIPFIGTLHDNSILRPVPLIVIEYLFVTILRIYGGNYFTDPIEYFAIGIVASFLINDPNTCLTHAMICSVLYSLSKHFFYSVLPLLFGKGIMGFILSFKSSGHRGQLIRQYLLRNSAILRLFDNLCGKVNSTDSSLSLYIDEICFYLSFHIIFYLIGRRYFMPVPIPESDLPSSLRTSTDARLPSSGNQKTQSSSTHKNNTSETRNNTQVRNRSNSHAKHGRNVSMSTNRTQHQSTAINGHSQASNLPTTQANVSDTKSINTSDSYIINAISNNLRTLRQTPFFSNLVSKYNVFEPDIVSPERSNSLAMPTNVDYKDVKKNESNSASNLEGLRNEFYQLKVDFSQTTDERNLDTDITPTSNIENFIRQLFEKKKSYIIPPLWSMFLTVKTANLERKYLEKKSEDVLTPISSRDTDNDAKESNDIDMLDIDTKLAIAELSDNGIKKSVFDEGTGQENLAMIIQSSSDDYNQLNLVSMKDNIFNRQENDYKVCIANIGCNSITFHIENLFEGELIVLVNGVIWSEVSCSLIMEHEGEELAVVNGLVPSCSYDIQFVNRLNQTQDHLMSDIVVRTASGNSGDFNGNFGSVDFTFPSYYHRKFLSPLLTLKHSVLTTNTNLAEERMKLKKSKKEISKKITSLKQESDHFRSKIENNATNEEKNASKVESLKIALQQSNSTILAWEEELKQLSEKQIEVEEKYLIQKDLHLRKQLEFSKEEEKLKALVKVKKENVERLQEEVQQLTGKLEKLNARNSKVSKEVEQQNKAIDDFINQLAKAIEKNRQSWEQQQSLKYNEYELVVKALQQDIARFESGNTDQNR